MHSLYGELKEQKNGKQRKENQSAIWSGSLSSDQQAVQGARVGGNSVFNVSGTGDGDIGREPILAGSDSGERLAGNVPVREQCREILKKSDSEITEEDKAILSQYEGAGGITAEKDRSTHGVLYEFYTPRSVIEKMWNIVHKYTNTRKGLSVLEPSAGTGRFAEGQDDNSIDMIELDETSSRIAKILNPTAHVTQGAFQSLFMKGRVPVKTYDGKKYDVVIGNPPYGSYNDTYKGWGEGADHKRYEEYFIDRGLDTLKDGGIMAFVVPSGFMRNGNNTEVKRKIAEKGRLLEAWRLPNGVFSTTGVGTDIIILRKEKGEVNDFIGDGFFLKNTENILGDETIVTGRHGKEKFVSLKPGESFDSAVSHIDPAKHGVPALGKKPMAEEQKDAIAASLKGNQNAKKDGIIEKRGLRREKSEATTTAPKTDVTSVAEFNAKYNRAFKPYELGLWNATNFDGSIRTEDIPAKDMELFKKSGDYCVENGKVFHRLNYVSGNIYDKLEAVEADRDRIGKAHYEKQKQLLTEALPKKKGVKNITISPISQFAQDFVFLD